MNLTKNFDFNEFTSSKTARILGIDNTIKDDKVYDNIRNLVVNILQPLRDNIGKPIYINSGFRCEKLNNTIGGVPTSQHLLGEAADIVVDNKEPFDVAKMILDLELPFDQLGLYDTFIHVSYSDKHRREIFYDISYDGKRNQI